MGTLDISLPARRRIVFPPICVVCETSNPDGQIELSILGAHTESVSMFAAEELLDVGSARAYSNNTTHKIDGIPACRRCAGSLKWYHRLLKFATYTAWIPGLIIMLLIPAPIYVSIVMFLAVVIAPPILSMIFPPAFGATFLNGRANFEFRSKAVADEFERLNPDPAKEAATV